MLLPPFRITGVIFMSPDEPQIPFAREDERLAVSQRASLSSCCISNGFDAAFNLRQPIIESSLSLAKRCAGVGVKPLFVSKLLRRGHRLGLAKTE
jgi:hypothetical protein